MKACATKRKVFLLVVSLLLGASCTGAELPVCAKFKTLQPIYLEGVYDSLNNKTVSRETARAYITAEKYARRSEVAFQVEVPEGTVITLISSAEHVFHMPYLVHQYNVRLSPDLSRGLEVVMSVDRGLEGDKGGLNPEIFKRIENAGYEDTGDGGDGGRSCNPKLVR